MNLDKNDQLMTWISVFGDPLQVRWIPFRGQICPVRGQVEAVRDLERTKMKHPNYDLVICFS